MIYITLGDPYSINIEMIVKLIHQTKLTDNIILIGSHWHWQHQIQSMGLDLPTINKIYNLKEAHSKSINFLCIETIEKEADQLTSLERGQIATRSLDALKKINYIYNSMVITSPIDKHACSLAGFNFPGQTEFFENLWQGEGIMVLAGPRLKVGLVTNHLPLSSVSQSINSRLIKEKIQSFHQVLKNLYGITSPKIAVCGLNPHCGDNGLFGTEDQDIIAPTIKNSQASFPFLTGPIPADTAFWKALQGQFDGVLAMYHDQGLGPLKTIHFDDAINITGGLKHLRISPDHGPAKDLYLTGKASDASFKACFDVALRYIQEFPK